MKFHILVDQVKSRISRSEEFIKFCFVGSSGVLVNMGVFILLTRIFRLVIEVASPIAIELSILSNFLLNNFWTFKARRVETSFWKRMMRFHLVSFTAGLINYLVLLSLVYLLGLWDLAANLIGIAVATVVNFVLNSRWTWQQKLSDSQIFKSDNSSFHSASD